MFLIAVSYVVLAVLTIEAMRVSCSAVLAKTLRPFN